jgi:hypothetical protein
VCRGGGVTPDTHLIRLDHSWPNFRRTLWPSSTVWASVPRVLHRISTATRASVGGSGCDVGYTLEPMVDSGLHRPGTRRARVFSCAIDSLVSANRQCCPIDLRASSGKLVDELDPLRSEPHLTPLMNRTSRGRTESARRRGRRSFTQPLVRLSATATTLAYRRGQAFEMVFDFGGRDVLATAADDAVARRRRS